MRNSLRYATIVLFAIGCGSAQAKSEAPAGPPLERPEPVATIPATPPPFTTPPVLAGTADVASLVERTKPSVVHITTTHAAPQRAMPLPFDLFGELVPPGFRGPGGAPRGSEKKTALGSGFVVDNEGRIVTNAHVIENAESIRVRFADDEEYEAQVLGKDERLDLAVLQAVGAKGRAPVSLGSSESLRVGEYVVAIGNPFGLDHTVTMGIVSAKSRSIGAGPYDEFIQTDASINPGNSGGPLFNLLGQVVGINTAINPNGRGIGFAIPSDVLKEVLPQLISRGSIVRGRLGVVIQPVEANMARALGLDRARGALVAEVEPDGPAAKAGIVSGDVILEVDGTKVARSTDLPRLVARKAPGSAVKLALMRGGKPVTLSATLVALEESPKKAERSLPDTPEAPVEAGLGIGIADAPGGGALIRTVRPDGTARGKLVPGDVVVEAGRSPVRTASDLKAKVAALPKGEPLLLKVRRQGRTTFVAVEK